MNDIKLEISRFSVKKNMNRRKGTCSLLPRNNFMIGLGSIMNLRGSYFGYSYSKTAQEADEKALRSDWEAVGEDISSSASASV